MEIRFRITKTTDGKFKVDAAQEPFGGLADPWSHFGDFDTADEAAEECGKEVGYQFRRTQVTELAAGPYRRLERASEDAHDSVDPPYTLWAVVELFGPGFDRPAGDGSGETWGELWVLPAELVDEFAEIKGAETHQIVESAGYETPDETV